MKILFWEKPGCMGNARQKALLVAAGHDVEAQSLPDHRWTRQELDPYLGGLAVPDWFNRGARRVKEGEVDPDSLSSEEALAVLLADPILIRRPLVQIGSDHCLGFDLGWIESRVGRLRADERLERLRSEDLTACPGELTGIRCGDPRD